MPLPLLATAGRLRSVVALSTRPTTASLQSASSGRLRNGTVSSLHWRIPRSPKHASAATFTTLSNHSALAAQDHISSASPLDTSNSDDNNQDWRSRVIMTSAPTTTLDSYSSGASAPSSSSSGSASEGESDNDNDRQQFIRRKVKFTPEMDREIIRLRDEEGLSWSAIGSKLGVPHRGCHRRYNSLLDPKLQECWDEEKLRRLDELVAEGKSWIEIARILDVTTASCQAKWRSMVKPKDHERNRVFDTLQSKVLLKLVKEHGLDDWKAVMRGFMLELGGRDMAKVTPEQLRHQYYCLKRKPTRYWSLNEETALIQHVLKHGTGQWEMISEAFKDHSPEQCKEKWTTLDMTAKVPKIKSWYKSEQANFWRLWQRYGSDWGMLARSLPTRTAEQCEIFFNKATGKLDREDPQKFQRGVQEIADQMSQYKTITWKKEDSELLWAVAEECRTGTTNMRVNWTLVAERMKLNLTPAQYKHHHYYLRTIRKGGLAGIWTDEEIRKLERVVQEEGRNWTLISKKYFPYRNSKSLCHKFISLGNRGWNINEEEYDTLLAKVDLQEQAFQRDSSSSSSSSSSGSSGEFKPDWDEIARAMPGGTWTAEQCQKAYDISFKNHLKNSRWTAEEDSDLLKAVKMLGRKNWVGVAATVPGKNSWECRMRFAELHEPLVEGTEPLPGLSSKSKEHVFKAVVGFITPPPLIRMPATQKEMQDARLPLGYRDFCADLLILLNKCRSETYYLPFKCQDERHIYEKCQYDDYLRRMKAAKEKREAADE
ncbi:hypothetical protein BGX23_004433 [Mortierella sp. AD031]|nr:hypothetical protein BGX23_004433 [Mortierella sp. AD031]